MTVRLLPVLACWLLLAPPGAGAPAAATPRALPPDLAYRFPTDNEALAAGRPEEFYMYTDRNFEGVKSKPWTGGCYGFTRTQVRTASGPVCVQFHEGIDIRPLKRDAAGEPLDEVRPMAPGVVVHASADPRKSNYGRYVVVEHTVPEGHIYSLYAHLGAVSCREGQRVGTGNKLGTMGHSGAGLNRERSHVHVELCLLLNANFQKYYDSLKLSTPNAHGIYNGMNLAGFDVSKVLLACSGGKTLCLRQFFAGLEEQYRVRVPFQGTYPDWIRRYPFVWSNPKGLKQAASIDISFTGEGVPFRAAPSTEAVQAPVVVRAKPWPFDQKYRTVSRVSGSSRAPVLTPSGLRYIRLLMLGSL